MKKSIFLTTRGVLFLLLVINLLSVSYAVADSNTAYLRYNTHVIEKVRSDGSKTYYASVDNILGKGEGNLFIPAGTQIRFLSKRSDKLWFRIESDNLLVIINFNEPRMQMKVVKYIDLITSPQPVSFAGLSDIDIKGMNRGEVLTEMSREGVLAAYGYPAVYQTPSLDAATWIYSAGAVRVHFGTNGLVKTVE